MEKLIIDQQLVEDIRTFILQSKQEFATTQQVINLLNRIQNLEKIKKDVV